MDNAALPRRLMGVNFPFNALVNVIHCRPNLKQGLVFGNNGAGKQVVRDVQRYYKQLTTGQGEPPSHKLVKSCSAAILKDNDSFLSIVDKLLGRTGLPRLMFSGLSECGCQEEVRVTGDKGHVMNLTSWESTNAAVEEFLPVWFAGCAFCNRPRNWSAVPGFMFLSYPENSGTIIFDDVLVRGSTFRHVATLYRGHDEQCWMEVLNANPVWTASWLRMQNNIVTVAEPRTELISDGLCMAVYERL